MKFTVFTNPIMPFIRYDSEDYCIPSEQECECVRKSVTFERIEGRIEEFIRTPDGRKIIGVNQIF